MQYYNRLLVKRRREFRDDAAAQAELEKWYALPDGKAAEEFRHLVDYRAKTFGAPVLYEVANRRCLQDYVVYRDPRNRFVVQVNTKSSLLERDQSKYFECLIRTLVIPTEKFYDIVDADKEDCNLLNEMAQTIRSLFDQLSFRIKVARLTERATFNAIAGQDMDEEEELAALEKLDHTMTNFIRFYDSEYLFLYFHPHPTHTVGQLHMHAVITDTPALDCYDSVAVSLAAVNRIILDTEKDLDSDDSERDATDWMSYRHRSLASSAASVESSD
ncbi:hypothetical protein H4R34_001903 [Dimargaris verticillata]|uniref:Uncharacterized protein n=1 Tax=Dimargaris verticillata TaxID=2761393 RepID=A0A9W8B9U6_9FUNG|nr:hypothetical protein H4R34_001903 [Dimargaris verticillata]